MWIRMFLFTSIFVLGMGTPVGAVTQCTVTATPVQEGQPTSITCYFEEDVSVNKATVNVYKTTSEKNQVLVVSYMWPTNSTEPQITVHRNGYRVSQPVGRYITITIDSATVDQTGDYMCQLLPLTSWEPCHLEVKEKAAKTSCTVQSVPAGESTTITCSMNINILRGPRQFILQKRPLSNDGEEFTTVVDCIRREHDRGKYPTCHPTVDGYAVISNQTTALSFRVNLLNVSQIHEGTYVCKIISVLLAEEETTCDFRLTVSGAPENKKGLIIGISIGMLPLVALVVAVCFFIHKRCVPCSHQAPEDLNNGDNLNDSNVNDHETQNTGNQASTRYTTEAAPLSSALLPYTAPQQYASEQLSSFLKTYFSTDLTV